MSYEMVPGPITELLKAIRDLTAALHGVREVLLEDRDAGQEGDQEGEQVAPSTYIDGSPR